MKRPDALTDFVNELSGAISDERRERINRYTTQLFERALTQNADGTVFVVTGDIPAMWIRDSTWQLRPLLRMNPDQELALVIAGVSRMQARFLTIDPYANAFNVGPTGECWHKDFADQSLWVFERKFEIDSLAAFFELAISLCCSTGEQSHLDDEFWRATEVVLDVIENELDHVPGSYVFVRKGAPDADHLSHGGIGAPFQPCGLVWSGFRPSDDRCVYPFNIPGNAHLAVTLSALALIAREREHNDVAERCSVLAKTIETGLAEVATTFEVLPYEVDGMGNALFEDDPNFPSLLSLPFLGWSEVSDPKYAATRNFLLSNSHRLWRTGKHGEGLASDHTPDRNIWPLAIAMRGLTANTFDDKDACLSLLERCDAGTGSMHESFDVDDPAQFTRPWFSWADMSYCDLALDVAGVPGIRA